MPFSLVQIRFPVWRELKRGLGSLPDLFMDIRSDTLSRLKGIETKFGRHRLSAICHSSDTLSRLKGIETGSQSVGGVGGVGPVQIRFPVWRELKHWVASGWQPWPHHVQIRFPVWRELKRFPPLQSDNRFRFRYAFPFEGNWNRLLTSAHSARQKRFRYAFPFEGNWNLIWTPS